MAATIFLSSFSSKARSVSEVTLPAAPQAEQERSRGFLGWPFTDVSLVENYPVALGDPAAFRRWWHLGQCKATYLQPGDKGNVKKLVETCISDSWSCSRFTP